MTEESNKQTIRDDVEDGQIKSEFGNINSKEIWKNELLCAQFLRGYVNVPLLEDVQPEDIEDITEALRPFVGVEYEGDAVKRIRLHGKESEVFVVGLLEHKSDVDYDVTFQLLKYMTGIWTLHRHREDKERPQISRNKGFRYPLIIPIVYYEGKEKWTADMHWKDRVEFSDVFGKYVPDFTYEVVRLRSYSNEELLSKDEELSLVMLLNRIQAEDDLDFRKWPQEQRAAAEKILRNAPEDVLRILEQMVHYFGLKMGLPDEKLRQCVKSVKERDMGELWANMDINYPAIMKRLEAQAQAKVEAEMQAKIEAEARAKVEAEIQAKIEAEARAKVEAEIQAKIEAEMQALLQQKDDEIAALRAENEQLKKK